MTTEIQVPKAVSISMDIEAADKEKLKAVFPQCFTEGKLDIDKLLSLCGEYIDNDFEKYKFEWKGKSECYRIAGKRSTGTLRPCPEESVNFDTTNNLYIEGDNLEVLKLLQTAYYRKVKMIYIDPPYNTGNDFVYEDDFKDPMAKYKEITSQTTKSNPETMGRYHTNWLNMMYPRLRLAANLLRDDGVIFISIDDNEITNLRKICDEVFGEENFIGIIIQNKQNSKNDTLNIQKNHEYILAYRKSIIFDESGASIIATVFGTTQQLKDVFEENGEYYYINDPITTRGDGGVLRARPNLGYTVYYNPQTKDKIAVCDYEISKAQTAKEYSELYTDRSDLIARGYVDIRPPKVRGHLGVWTWSLERFNENKKSIIITGKPESYAVKKRTFVDKACLKMIDGKLQYSSLVESNVKSIWDFSTNEGTKILNDVMTDSSIFNNAKNLDMIKNLIRIVPFNDNDIILDFFSGSATTAHAVMQLNAEDGGKRQFIMVQLPEICDETSEAFKAGYKNICEIGKERIRRAGTKILESFFPSPLRGEGQGEGDKLNSKMDLLDLAKDMRYNSTEAEKKLWYSLNNQQLGYKFRRQHQIGNYIVDFVCLEKKLVVECDGGQHTQDNDKERNLFLEKEGYQVLRFWNNDILSNLDGVLVRIKEALDNKTPHSGDNVTLTPTLSPQGRGGIPDVGFKVFKLDTSNLVKWDDTPLDSLDTADLFNRLDGMEKSLKKDRTDLDVVYEVMAKLGIPLTYKVSELNINSRKVYSIGDDGLILVCLDASNGGITPEDITAMCELAPAKIIAAEEAFKDDVSLSNAYYISKDSGVAIELL